MFKRLRRAFFGHGSPSCLHSRFCNFSSRLYSWSQDSSPVMTWLRKSSPSNCYSWQHAILCFFYSSTNTLHTIFTPTFFIPKFCVRMLCTDDFDDFGEPSSTAIMRTSFLQSSVTAANTHAMFLSVPAVEGRPSCGLSLQLSCPSMKRFTHLQTVELFIARCPYTDFNMVLIIWASYSFAARLRHSLPWHRGCLHTAPRMFTHGTTQFHVTTLYYY